MRGDLRLELRSPRPVNDLLFMQEKSGERVTEEGGGMWGDASEEKTERREGVETRRGSGRRRTPRLRVHPRESLRHEGEEGRGRGWPVRARTRPADALATS